MLARTSSAERSSSGQGLAERRKRRRRLLIIWSCILVGVILGTVVWGLQQASVRISQVTVYGADQSFSHYATDAMQGKYLGLIPRDSILFFPESRIRAAILADHPDIAALSIFRSGLTSISLKITERTAIARWCGLAHTPDVQPYCYVFDANGFVFGPDSSSETPPATSTPPLNSFVLYAPLSGASAEPLRSTIAHADVLPAVFDFARQLSTFGSPVTSITISTSEEVTDVLASGTSITYVLGHEQVAYTALVSAKDGFNLADGSVEYVDLRFDGKVYLKKKEAGGSKQ